jgi:hypothetical protein
MKPDIAAMRLCPGAAFDTGSTSKTPRHRACRVLDFWRVNIARRSAFLAIRNSRSLEI